MSLIHTQYQRMRGFSIGDRSRIFPHVTLKGKIIIGKKSKIKHYSMLLASGGYIKIGDNCTINPFCILYGHGGLDIGNGVRIAAHTVIIPANHEMHPDLPIFRQPVNKIGIVIEDDVWLGAGVRVLDGVRICAGSVIGAGAVVTKDTQPFGIYVGVPARQIGTRKTSEPDGLEKNGFAKQDSAVLDSLP